MVRALEVLRYLSACSLIALGVGGVAATLLGVKTVSPLFSAGAIVAGAGALPEVADFCWSLRRYVPVG